MEGEGRRRGRRVPEAARPGQRHVAFPQLSPQNVNTASLPSADSGGGGAGGAWESGKAKDARPPW